MRFSQGFALPLSKVVRKPEQSSKYREPQFEEEQDITHLYCVDSETNPEVNYLSTQELLLCLE